MAKIFNFNRIANLSRFQLALLLGVVFCATYLTTNHLDLLPARTLPLFWFETLVPFAPWTAVIYVSSFLQPTIALFVVDRRFLVKIFCGATLLMCVDALIFLFFPTIYPRPITPTELSFLGQVFYKNIVLAADTARNCFPSNHVALAVFVSLAVGHWQKKWGIAFGIWTLLVALSTLTTKQHYFVDVISGVGMGVVAYWITFKTSLFQTDSV